MEWVETTGKAIEDAVAAALDLLGVDESELEYEVLEEPKAGLFGRTKREARIRARIKPAIPRSKDNRRRRPRRERSVKTSARNETVSSTNGDAAETAEKVAEVREPAAPRQQRRPRPSRVEGEEVQHEDGEKRTPVPVVDQAGRAQTFLAGLMKEFGVPGQVEVKSIEEDNVSVAVTGEANFGLLIGPKGFVMSSVQELTRAAVQNTYGHANARVFVDVGGFREQRRVSLERFSARVAEEVIKSGESRVLEPMNAADRKVVHDTMAGIAGVMTRSEGTEPRRYVIVSPASEEQAD